MVKVTASRVHCLFLEMLCSTPARGEPSPLRHVNLCDALWHLEQGFVIRQDLLGEGMLLGQSCVSLLDPQESQRESSRDPPGRACRPGRHSGRRRGLVGGVKAVCGGARLSVLGGCGSSQAYLQSTLPPCPAVSPSPSFSKTAH